MKKQKKISHINYKRLGNSSLIVFEKSEKTKMTYCNFEKYKGHCKRISRAENTKAEHFLCVLQSKWISSIFSLSLSSLSHKSPFFLRVSYHSTIHHFFGIKIKKETFYLRRKIYGINIKIPFKNYLLIYLIYIQLTKQDLFFFFFLEISNF